MSLDPSSAGARRRRRRRPWLVSLAGALLLALSAALWYMVVDGLGEAPEAWLEKEQRFRQAIREVLVGATDEAGLAPELPRWPGPLPAAAERIALCADTELARGVAFHATYRTIDYPWGDVPAHLATSADLLIRCLRAIELDLQQLVHLDRTAHAKRYPLHLWGGSGPDKSVDHRRLPNLYAFFRAFLPELPRDTGSPEARAAFLPGDVVFWAAAGGEDHPGLAGIVTDRRDETGMPRCVTIDPADRRVSDAYPVNKWPIRGHFRVDPDALMEAYLAQNPRVTFEPRP